MAQKVPDRSKFVAWWGLQEASGSRVDEVAGYTLSDVNTVGQGTGYVLQNAADFERGNNEALSGADADWNDWGDEDVTFSFWINLETLTDNVFKIVNKNSAYDMTKDDAERFTFKGAQTGQGVLSPAGDWFFCLAWHDSSGDTDEVEVYNSSGTLVGSGSNANTGTVGSSTSEFTLGARESLGSYITNLDGRLEQFSIYGGLFTTEEKNWMINGGAGRSYFDLLGQRIIGVV